MNTKTKHSFRKKKMAIGMVIGLITGLVMAMLLGVHGTRPTTSVVTTTKGNPVVLLTSGPEKQPTGAVNAGGNIGRYQIAAWSTNWGTSGGGYGAFIVDTTTGETKMAYNYVFAENGKERVRINNLGKPFRRISP